jgi:pimeloyl-ACP methyl ester carboxylesterase
VSARNARHQLLAAMRYRAPGNGLASPVLILVSGQDALVDASCSRQLAQRWNAAISEHPTAGHDLPLDDGPWVVRKVKHWLQALP